MKLTLLALASAALVSIVRAECPNGCSGSGTCSAKDMCECFKNYHGNDCSLRTCPSGHAHVDTPLGDLNMDGTIATATVAANSEKFPYGSWELYPGGATTDEAHFYQECSGRGLCDTEAGLCNCFDGYEGSACQRTVCPNACSGHGTCESISEFASDAKGTLFGKEVTETRTYDLWDAKVSYGCRCDPWYYGADCSLRRCKVGVDPMYEAVGTEILETIAIRLVSDTATLSSKLRIRFFDYWGESYITDKITFNAGDKAATITSFQNAFLGLPNSVISTITCEEYDSLGAATTIFPYLHTTHIDATAGNTDATTKYVFMVCRFTSNPGRLRLPEIASMDAAITGSSITGTVYRGEDYDMCTLENSNAVTGITTATVSIAGNAAPSVPFLAKIAGHYTMISADDGAGSLTSVTEWKHAAVANPTPLYYAPTTFTVGSTTYTTVRDTGLTAACNVGSKVVTMSGAGHGLVLGETMFMEDQLFVVTSVSGVTVNMDRPFGGIIGSTANNGAAATSKVYEIIPPSSTYYTYVSECSGRGLCDRETGVCSCFKGFTNDNCDTQNIFAL